MFDLLGIPPQALFGQLLLGLINGSFYALLSLGLKDFFGFSFHLVGFFFLFRGLLASRHVRENATSY